MFNGGDASDSSRTDYYPSPKEKINITFVRSDILSRAFYNALRAEVKDTDFSAIYVALGDDKFAIETAMEIRQFLRESGVDLQLHMSVSNRQDKTHCYYVFQIRLQLNYGESGFSA